MRGNARLRAATAAVLITASLGGCGVVDRVTTASTITAVPPDPAEITFPPTSPTPSSPTNTGNDGPTTAAGAKKPAPASPTAPDRPRPAPAGVQPTERLVIVDRLHLGLAAPLLFSEIDPEKYTVGSAALDDLARQMGLTPKQVRTAMLDRVDRMVVGRGDDGRPASIVVVLTPLDTLPSATLLRHDLEGILGGTVTKVSRTPTPAGTAVRCAYRLGAASGRQYGEALYLETAEGVVSVTATAWTAAGARQLADRVVKTIRNLE